LGVLNFNTLFSHFDATQATRTGYAYNANFNPPRLGRFSLYAGWGQQSLNYTTPSTALSLGSNASFTNDSFKSNAFLSLGVGFDHWGSFNVGTSQQSSWSDVGSNQVRFGYSNRIRQVNLGLNWDRATYSDGRPPQTSISISASIPLGSGPNVGNARASMSQINDNEPSQTLSYSGYVSEEQISYNLNQSQTADNSTTSASGGFQHRYGSLGVSVSSSTGNSQQTGLNANGGLVFHSGGVILAPSVSETFAIVEVPQGEGVGLIGSAARINRSGFGVLPAIAPYSFNDVQISLEGASPDLEIDNASQKVAPVEGSIVRLKFNTSSGKPLLIVFQPTSGVLVPIGATVFDSQGNEVGTVGQGSRAMVRVQSLKDRLKAVWGDKASENCSAEYDLNAKNVTSSNGYTLLKIRCEMAGEKEIASQTVTSVK
jgi:outer membrane usher protein